MVRSNYVRYVESNVAACIPGMKAIAASLLKKMEQTGGFFRGQNVRLSGAVRPLRTFFSGS